MGLQYNLMSQLDYEAVRKDLILIITTLAMQSGLNILDNQSNSIDLNGAELVLNGTLLALIIKTFKDIEKMHYNQREFSFKTNEVKIGNDNEKVSILYKTVLENIRKLLNEFDFRNPVEIYASQIYMMKKGIICCDKKMVITGTDTRDLPKLLGAEVICGRGDCKNINPLLVDILNTMNINAYVLSVGFNNKIEASPELKELELTNSNAYSEILSRVEEGVESEEERYELYHRAKNLLHSQRIADFIGQILYHIGLPNHIISCAEYNDKYYILDAINALIYRALSSNRFVLFTDEKHKVKNSFFIATRGELQTEEDVEKIKELLKKETISYEEYASMWRNTIDKCIRNDGVFEEFYTQNQDLYRELKGELDKCNVRFKRMREIAKP